MPGTLAARLADPKKVAINDFDAGPTLNILLVTHRLPFPPNDGAKIRAYQILRHLGAKHRLSVACVDVDPHKPKQTDELATACARLSVVGLSQLSRFAQTAGSLFSGEPASFAAFRSKRLKDTIEAWHAKEPFDLAIGYSGCTDYYLSGLDGICRLMDLVDLDSEKWFSYQGQASIPMRWVYGLEGRKTRAKEKAIGKSFDGVTVTTLAEMKDLQALQPTAACEWFSNGVDTEFFQPTDQPYSASHLCFLGKMDYLPNVRACALVVKEVLPRIREKHPSARFTIIGSSPNREVMALAEHPGVHVTGFVDDVRTIALTACCMVAPLDIARGVQNKLLEAMAMGLPVVTSALAARGVDARPGIDLLLADDAQSITNQCLRLMENEQDRTAISTSARQRVEQAHSWSHCLSRLDRFLTNLSLANQKVGSSQ